MERDAALEAAIVAAPEDLVPRMVYGDWLQDRGELRGQWVAMMGVIERAPDDIALRAAAVGYLDEHRHELLGSGVPLLASSYIGWYGGFVDELRIQPAEGTTAADVIQLIGHPMCRFVRHLALGRIPELPDVIEAVVAAELPLLEELVVHDALWGRQAELPAIAELVTLRRLTLSSVRVGRPMPQLRGIMLVGGMAELDTEWLAGCPNVETLSLVQSGFSVLEPQTIVAALALPHLRELELIGTAGLDAAVERVAEPPRLTRLAIGHASVSRKTLDAIARWPGPPEVVVYAEDGDAFEPTALDDRHWILERFRTGGRHAVRSIPIAGTVLYNMGTRRLIEGDRHALEVIPYLDACATLPSTLAGTHQWANAAIAHERAGHLAEAELRAREALLHVPGEPNFHAIYIDAVRRLGRLDDATRALPAAIESLETPNQRHTGGASACLLDCLFVYAQRGEPREALALAKRFKKLVTPDARAVLAMCQLAIGRIAAARAELARAAASTKPVLQHAHACLALVDGDRRAARAAIAKAMRAGYTERAWVERDPLLAALREKPTAAAKPAAKSKAKTKPKAQAQAKAKMKTKPKPKPKTKAKKPKPKAVKRRATAVRGS